jgi:glycerophosphoryl diester phosphodiesterase
MAKNWYEINPIAHRGFHWSPGIDENSFEAFELAIEKGTPFECDLHLSKDGEAFIHHDFNLKRMTGIDQTIGELRSHELRKIKTFQSEKGIMSLKELLSFIAGKVPIVLEIKRTLSDDRLEARVLELLTNYRGDVTIQSFHPQSLLFFRKQKSDLILGLLAGKESLNDLSWGTRILLQSLSFAAFIRPDYIGYEWTGLHRRAPQEMRKNRHIPLISWTVNDKKSLEISKLLADNIIYENLIF